MTATLAGRTVLISGGSRGVGLAIARRAAADGANIVLLAKTDRPHPRLEGTIHTAVQQVAEAGGRGLAVVGDVRNDDDIARAVAQAVDAFGGIDACVNNASVLAPVGTLELDPRRYDLMQDVNVRGTFMLSRACLPHLLRSASPQILTLSPPLNVDPRWLGRFPGYLLAKYGMTLATLALAAEFPQVAANTLWPRTLIATAAVGNLLGGEAALARTRSPRIVADAAHAILTGAAGQGTGRTLVDDEVLAAIGVTDLSGYAHVPGTTDLATDIFLDPPEAADDH